MLVPFSWPQVIVLAVDNGATVLCQYFAERREGIRLIVLRHAFDNHRDADHSLRALSFGTAGPLRCRRGNPGSELVS